MSIRSRLDALDQEFLRALRADPAPLSDLALFWYEGMRFTRDAAAPNALCRGTPFLRYQRGAKMLKDVPGQMFATEVLPARECTAIISSQAADWAGPRSISFRYDRVDGEWVGGYDLDSSSEYRDQVLSRRDLDVQLAKAMTDHWTEGVSAVKLVYGVGSQEDPGPRVMVYRKGVRAPEFVPPSDGLTVCWQRFKDHIERGRWRLYSAEVRQEKAGAALAEGDTIEARYGR